MTACAMTNAASPFATGPEARYPSITMETTDPDGELVRLARLGDARAFEALVVKYQRRVARHVARWVSRASDVEDVVQDVFIKVYRGLASFKGESAFYTWVYQIARNTAFNFLSRQSKVVVLQEDTAAGDGEAFNDTQGSDHEDPERSLIAKQISETVELALKKLQPELAEALVLYEVEGKQYKEIAQMLQIPIGTVRTRIFRAREFIAKRLEPVVGPVRDRRW
jgi:RNA polymerase sigma-70 factor, ECF subfamily